MKYNHENIRDIRYEPSDKRRFYRLANPIKVIMEGKEYRTADWSINAFKIEDYTGQLSKGEKIPVIFEINFQGFAIKFEQKVEVLRKNPEKKTLVAKYIDVSSRNKEIFSCFSKGLITGEFQQFDEIIRHIDIPVSDNYIHETFEETPSQKSFSRRLTVFIYTLIGIAVIILLYNFYYSNFRVLKIDSAVVAGKTEILNSPSKGILSEIYVREDEFVEQGTPLFRISNPEIQKEIEEKKNEILKNHALLREKQKQLGNLLYKLENYKKTFSFKLKVKERLIESIGKKIDLLNEELRKKTRLYERKLVSQPEIDALKKEILLQEENLAAANYEYYNTYQNIEDPESGTVNEIHKREDSGSLKAEIERIKEIINIDKKELSYIESINSRNTVKAPFKAVSGEVLAFEGKYVDEKTPVLLLKDLSGEKFVEAYLTEEESLKLKIGLAVEINIPSRDIDLHGKLVKLKKQQEFLGKSLIIAVIQPERAELLEDVNEGTPASVVFIKNKFFKPRYTFNG